MSKLAHAGSFRDLIVYQKARELAREIYRISNRFPKEELYSLTDQIRRSSRSVGAQIAEAWAKKLYERHFISKLTDADGEQLETQHWIETAVDCGYISLSKKTVLLDICQEIGKMLSSMITKASQFCGDPSHIRETSPDYFTTDH
jgi:four helix bundle protein